jgi:hypothetical protein
MTQSEILHMRISADLRDGIDELRRREPDLPSKSEMVRRLVMRALGKEDAPRKAKAKQP